MILQLNYNYIGEQLHFPKWHPLKPTPHDTYIIYVAHRFKHKPMWHLAYLSPHMCHVEPMCRHMPHATFRPSISDHLG
jgi:hypothetical protein